LLKKYTEDVIKVTVSCGDLKSSPLAFDIQRDKFAIWDAIPLNRRCM